MKQEMKCPICTQKVYSSIGYGCRMCGMALENKTSNFCCKICMRKYKTINKRAKALVL
ncbi:hypothetical protein GOV14_01580 [Candidatus Pacearchaeota archaeon]|nr:hypothetical protein [Candidatus Pacearchaeota archaeon]